MASSSPLDRVRLSLESTGLLRFFDPYLFSAGDVPRGKPAPDLFLYVAAKMHVAPGIALSSRILPAGVAAAHAAGMSPIGFIGGSHTNPTLGAQLTARRRPRGRDRHAGAEKHGRRAARFLASPARP